MKNDITRLLSASVYLNDAFRHKIIEIAKDRYHTVAESMGLDLKLILEHALIAEKKNREVYLVQFVLGVLLFFSISSLLNSADKEISTAIFAFLLILSCIVVGYYEIENKNYMLSNFSKEKFNSSQNLKDPLIDNIDKRISENVIYYNSYSPFVGRGVEVGAWSFVVDVDRGKRNFDKNIKPEKFEIEELYEIVEKSVLSLKIPNLCIDDKVYINGKKIRKDRFFLPKINSHPINKLTPEDFSLVAKNENTDIRRYKVIEVTEWEGDLILSNFIRFQKSDSNLFVESNYFLLTSIEDKFREIDKIRHISGIRETFFWTLKIISVTLFKLLISFWKVYNIVKNILFDYLGFRQRENEKKVIRSTDYNYGSERSVREFASQPNYIQYFQKLDKEMHHKTIEKRIFNCINDFLESKGVDISDFKDRETSIINSGVIVTGGKLNTGNMAVGKKSKISFKKNEG